MNVDDRVAFLLEVQRLKASGLSVSPSVRGAWGLVISADVVGIVVGAVLMGSVPSALMTPAFAAGLAMTVVVGLALRRRLLRRAYGWLASRLLLPALGAVGGATSAAFPSSFSKSPTPPPPARQQDVVKPVRVGDPDAVDFDD